MLKLSKLVSSSLSNNANLLKYSYITSYKNKPVVSTIKVSTKFFSSYSLFTDSEVSLAESVAEFSKLSIQPYVKSMDLNGVVDKNVLKSLFEAGFMGIEIASNYGGSEMKFLDSCIIIQELAKVDPAISVIVDIQNTLINASVANYGSDAIKSKYLPLLAKSHLGSFCLSEASSGSDAFALKTKAIFNKDDNTYQIVGEKMWISNSSEADVFIVFTTIDQSLGYKGITAFILDRDTPGLFVGKKEDKLGIRASSTCTVSFDCKVRADQMLGEKGKGYKIAIGLLNQGRVGIAAQMVGLAQGAFNNAMPYVHTRKQFGKAISEFQGMQFSIAECATEIEAAQLLMINAARLCDANKEFVKEASMAKYYSSIVAEKVASKAVEWHGGIGFTKGNLAEKYYRDAKIGSIYEGTTNMQLQGIAKLISSEYKD